MAEIVGATAVIGGPVTFVVAPRNSPERERWLSTSRIVVEALLPGLLTGSLVTVEFSAGTNVIKRVLPYSIEAGGRMHDRPNTYQVTRIATQRTLDGREEHLEVFFKKHDQPERVANVSDSFLIAMLLAVFNRPSRFEPEQTGVGVQFEGNDVISITIGEP